jgi:hypothetical protein
MKLNFMTYVVIACLLLILVKGYKVRNTISLYQGEGDGKLLLRLLIVLGLLVIGTVYVWWANRRDSK